MTKKSDHLHMLLTTLEEVFGTLPPEVFSPGPDLLAAVEKLHARAYLAGHRDGLTEGKHGSRAIESYGQAVTPGAPKLSMTRRRDVDALVQIEGLPDPMAKKRRRRKDDYRPKSMARPLEP